MKEYISGLRLWMAANRWLTMTVVIALALAALALRAYWVPGMPFTHDGENHLARFANYKVALREGQFPPRIAPSLFNRYGYPVFHYNYPLANILSVGPGLAKISYQTSFKLQVWAAVSIGLLGSWWWVGQLQAVKSAGSKVRTWVYATTTLALLGSPYLLSLVLFRGNIGEVWGVLLLPVLLAYLKRSQQALSWYGWLGLVAVMTVWLLAHNVTVLIAGPLLASYVAVVWWQLPQSHRGRALHQVGTAGLTSLGLVAWFWLPAVLERSEVTVGQVDLAQNITTHFPRLSQLLSSTLEFGFSYAGSIDSLSFNLGWTQWIMVLLGLVMTLKVSFKSMLQKLAGSKWQLTKFPLEWWWATGALLILLALQLPVTAPLWQVVPVLKFVQFPWRLMSLAMIVMIPFAAHLLTKLPTRLGTTLVGLLAVQAVLLTSQRPVDYFSKANVAYETFAQSTSTNNENLPRTFTYLDIGDWQPAPSILEGDGTVTVKEWRTHRRRYTIISTTPVTMTEPTMRFLGWQTLADGRKVEYIDSPEIGGRIAYRLSAGQHQVETRFTQRTPTRMIGNTLSVGTALGLAAVLVKRPGGSVFSRWGQKSTSRTAKQQQ